MLLFRSPTAEEAVEEGKPPADDVAPPLFDVAADAEVDAARRRAPRLEGRFGLTSVGSGGGGGGLVLPTTLLLSSLPPFFSCHGHGNQKYLGILSQQVQRVFHYRLLPS